LVFLVGIGHLNSKTVARPTTTTSKVCKAIILFSTKIDDSIENKNGTRTTPIATIRELFPFLKKVDPKGWKQAADKTNKTNPTLTEIGTKYWRTNLRFRLDTKSRPDCINLTETTGRGIATRIKHSPLEGKTICPAYMMVNRRGGIGSIDATIVESAIEDKYFRYLVGIRKLSGIVGATNEQSLLAFTQSIMNSNRIETHGETVIIPKSKGPLYVLDIDPKPIIIGNSIYDWEEKNDTWYLDIPYSYNAVENLKARFQLSNGAITIFMSMDDEKYGLSQQEYIGYHEFVYDVLQTALGIDYNNNPLKAVQFDINRDIPKTTISPSTVNLLDYAIDNSSTPGKIKVEIEDMAGSYFQIYRVNRAVLGDCFRFEFCVRAKIIAEEFSILDETVSTIQAMLTTGLSEPVIAATRSGKTIQEILRDVIDPIPKYDRRINAMQTQLIEIQNTVEGSVSLSAMATEVAIQDGQLIRELKSTIEQFQGPNAEVDQQIELLSIIVQDQQEAGKQRDQILSDFLSRNEKVEEALELSEINTANITSILAEVRDFMKKEPETQLVAREKDEVFLIQRMVLDKTPNYKSYAFPAYKEVIIRKLAKEEVKIDGNLLVSIIKALEKKKWLGAEQIRKKVGKRRTTVLETLQYGIEVGIIEIDESLRTHKFNLV